MVTERPEEVVSGMVRRGISTFQTLIGGVTDALRAGDSTIKELDSALTGQASSAPTTAEQSFLEIIALMQAAFVEAREAGSASAPAVVQRAREALGRVSREEPAWRPAPSAVRTVNDVFRTALRDLRASQDLVKLAQGNGTLDDLEKLSQWADDLTDRLAKTQKIVAQPKPSKEQPVPAASAPDPVISQEIPADSASLEKKATSIKTGCIPCSLGHLGGCSSMLNEAMRFARKDGMLSNEVIDRVGQCLDELNGLERMDLRPEMIHALPAWEKELAIKALEQSRDTRHRLESVKSMTVDELEGIAADLQKTRLSIFRDWVHGKTDNLPPEAQARVRASIERSTQEETHG